MKSVELKSLATEILSETLSEGNGGYSTVFGPLTFAKLHMLSTSERCRVVRATPPAEIVDMVCEWGKKWGINWTTHASKDLVGRIANCLPAQPGTEGE